MQIVYKKKPLKREPAHYDAVDLESGDVIASSVSSDVIYVVARGLEGKQFVRFASNEASPTIMQYSARIHGFLKKFSGVTYEDR